MRRPRVASLVALATTFAISTTLLQCRDAGPSGSASSHSQTTWVVEPRTLDFGRYSSCDPPGPLAVRIANRSERPLAVGGWTSSCRCILANFGGVTEIEPGGHLDVAVTLKPWGMPGPHGHDLDLLLDRPAAPVGVRVVYRMDPEVSVPSELRSRRGNPDGLVRIESHDGQPARLLALDPPIPVEWSRERGTSIEFTMPWDLLDRIAEGRGVPGIDGGIVEAIRSRMRFGPDGDWRSLLVRATVDHPVCGTVAIPRANDRARGSATGE